MSSFGKDEINNIVKLSSFLAMGSGARGTPALFINEELKSLNSVSKFKKSLN